jgi:hypothetical protein
MVRRKTSIYIDDRIWEKFKEYASVSSSKIDRLK